MKKMKNVLCLLLICFLTFGSVSQIMAAKDTKGTASKKARVQTMLDSTFQPNQPVTRIQAITSIVRLIGFENEAKAVSASTKLPFKDASQLDKKYPGAKGYVV
ncbi:MAG: S-layer homology domain-containing protein, partial [Gorillibacterium sp.]|nr:S-layer homology domain-containing protein [Gorillibacterium sp.]